MLVVDRILLHGGHSPRHGVVGSLLAAAAVHSFLDGWSVRVFSGQPLAGVGVPLGLALHKIPEGVALGWITRKSLGSTWKAATLSGMVEGLTLVGAFVEPGADQSGAAEFGAWWTAAVLGVIAGSFLFLGSHAVLPERRKSGVLAVFAATFLLVGTVALLHRRTS